MKVKKMLALAVISLTGFGLVACGNTNSGNGQSASGKIEVISRENGSGTRGAFTEITGILKKDGDKETDNTTKTAVIQNSTEGVLSAVQGNANAIGYISLGSLTKSVKALAIDGVKASRETVLDGEYPLQRPFNIVWSSDLSQVGQDFIKFIHSKQGQQVVTENKFIEAKTETAEYTSRNLSGKLSVVGSTSVSPLMEKLAEAYKKENPEVTIDITSNGSSAGITAAKEKTADIGMVSRELSPEEGKSLTHDAIALDGIAVVVNNDNKTSQISMAQLADVFSGQLTTWDKLK
ncbi:substrate-binding domain-containing protein [Streptococcus dysgalactiae]|uniref:substrate-binding domain-containing protein n=1 Tax=Streptococcus dysgalactiae TaxID=1334 RepID=UPI0010CAC28A|nr:substrate-binding domain-containing protein [Streptococcus dysgalactiae]MDY2963458.1 substrate-binding domain-containing protein [Streptococcus dysgalactiae]MDY4035515.1 substrate-binding domain-containing protein [Streptococcus dysgalactiae]MEC4578352.1 substrate-binding domain-containing protein [Streptococcus dysgalactiae]QZT27839.1 extracellular solute-binding protein [Streptococcus dysgalactiae]VTS99356.1 phosphate ABC transporter substrate-binding protein [Streptococcus dysgalactiae]